MHIGADPCFQLTYCTNIHPANGWPDVLANLRRYAPALKARLAPERPFGLGLRLSGQESVELLQGTRLQQFRSFLDEQGLYVFTLNGFPYGPFHQQPVKAEVHAPDWRDEERVQYTLRLIEILAALLPDDGEGGISTNPLSYKPWINTGDTATWECFTRNVVRIAAALVRVAQDHGKLIHIDIEPEPDGVLESSADLVRFYREWLLPRGADMLADELGVGVDEARWLLLEHIRVCFDTCHMAVAFEDPSEVLARFDAIGIKVGKVQISSALKVMFPADLGERTSLERGLQPFVESTYLHQVVQRNRDGTRSQFPDLMDALGSIHDPRTAEWRIHFHVPIFMERYGPFLSTQPEIKQVLALLQARRFSQHLEIETYTWDVLPPDLKHDLTDSIAREYAWVRHVFL